MRKTDFVLVTNKERIIELVTFVRNLEDVGLQFQIAEGISVDLIFLKIHIPEDAIDHFVKVYDMEIKKRKHIAGTSRFRFFSTPEADTAVYKPDGVATTAEKSFIINSILENTRYGAGEDMCGIAKLLKLEVIIAAYPLHDGSADWKYTISPLNDRQLLSKHWASMDAWFKEQPLDLIEKYFGTEIAFYFAWTGFFNQMLILAAGVGLIVFICSLIQRIGLRDNFVTAVCTSEWKECPTCQDKNYCTFHEIKHNCFNAKWGDVFDNYFSIFFACFMTVWSKLFLELWKREESRLKLQWESEMEEMDTELRLEFKERTKYRQYSNITGELEPYVPRNLRCLYLTITVGVCIVLIVIAISAILLIIYYKLIASEYLHNSRYSFVRRHAKLFVTITGTTFQIIIMKTFGSFYKKTSFWLTDMENPRTQSEYKNSIMYKGYFFAFINYYAVFFYLAYFKGHFFSCPIALPHMNTFQRDTCGVNCIVYFNIQLAFLMIFKKLMGNLIVFTRPKCKRMFRKKHHTLATHDDIPQWEKEFKLVMNHEFHVTAELTEMIIEFGFVTFFVAAFPLAPLCALINNVFEIRLDAYKLTNVFRRPVPVKSSGIGAWNGILLGVSYLGTVTNAFIVAFTSEFVSTQVYFYNHGHSTVGYFNYTYTSFDTKDYSVYVEAKAPDVCYYKSLRYPHDHEKKYQLTGDYWIELTWRFIVVFLFEHFLLALAGVIAYIIPDMPIYVKSQLMSDKIYEKKLKQEALSEIKEIIDKRHQRYKPDVDTLIRHRRPHVSIIDEPQKKTAPMQDATTSPPSKNALPDKPSTPPPMSPPPYSEKERSPSTSKKDTAVQFNAESDNSEYDNLVQMGPVI